MGIFNYGCHDNSIDIGKIGYDHQLILYVITVGYTIQLHIDAMAKFIRNREIPELLKRRKIGMKILPVLVESCAWKHVPWLADIQIKDQVPLSKSNPDDQDDKLASIVDLIIETFDELEE